MSIKSFLKWLIAGFGFLSGLFACVFLFFSFAWYAATTIVQIWYDHWTNAFITTCIGLLISIAIQILSALMYRFKAALLEELKKI